MQIALRVPNLPLVPRKFATAVAVALLANLVIVAAAQALDLVTFSGISGPLTGALTQLATLTPGIKALVTFIAFVVAFITLAALRNFSSVLFFIGMAIFGAVGLVIAGAILGAVI